MEGTPVPCEWCGNQPILKLVPNMLIDDQAVWRWADCPYTHYVRFPNPTFPKNAYHYERG
jgi:hypothetical protein